MTKKLDKLKIRSRLVRKGIFTQLPYPSKEYEPEARLFRTLLDQTLFEATSKDSEERNDAFRLMNPETTCVNLFNQICTYAVLDPRKTRSMMLTFIDNFFPEVFEETSCSFRL